VGWWEVFLSLGLLVFGLNSLIGPEWLGTGRHGNSSDNEQNVFSFPCVDGGLVQMTVELRTFIHVYNCNSF